MFIFGITILIAVSFFAGVYFARWKNKGAYNKIIELNDLSNEISTSVDQVSSVSEEIVNASIEQLDALHSAVSASQQIRSMVERTTDNAKVLEDDANKLQKMVSSGNQVVNEMVSSSNEIKEALIHFRLEMNKRIEELAKTLKVIQEIATKTQVIDEIVFQTKLLSFNASVEAARAGEAGKGFGVVADEVGKLAHMSGNSSREISDLVSRSVKIVDEAVKTTKQEIESLTSETTSKGEEGLLIAKKCEELFKVMEDKIINTAQLAEQISSATTEQSIGVSQVDDSIVKFQETTDKNRLVASQATEHSREFKDQANNLIDLVGQYSEIFSIADKQRKKKYKKFIWNSKLELDIANMDNEHRILVNKINKLIDVLENTPKGHEQSAAISSFKDLADYTIEHFSHEETYLESIKYPQLKSHQKIHKKLLEQVMEYGQELKGNRLDEMKFISFLRNWLISHIMGVDMQYSEFAHKSNDKGNNFFAS